MLDFFECDSGETAGEALAQRVADLLREGIEERDKASLVVCGGTSQNHFFAALSQQELAWDKVSVILGDERWVTAGHEDSSEKLVREKLLINEAAAAHLLSLAVVEDAPAISLEKGAARATELLATVPQPFDANVVGMGEDGHFASLFPNHPALEGALDEEGEVKLVAVADSPKPPAERISFSLAAHLNAREVFVNMNGEEKLRTFETVLKHEGDALEYPIMALLKNNKTPVNIYWCEA